MKKIKKLILITLKLVSSLSVAYVIAFIGKELLAYSSFSFIFIICSASSGFFYFMKPYKIKGVLMLNLVLIGIVLLMRFYIKTAYIPV